MPVDRRSRDAVRVARALGDPTRFDLLRCIAERGEICCRDLTSIFEISQATVSHHLGILSEAGLVTSRRAGQFHYFRIRPVGLRAYDRSLSRALGPAWREARS
ncbi:MAG TPA: metalloregulator ArsR/SmtB family transcription factor [Anaeromyxobacteraceae bacterium]|nr:metalloregulator ArsR/SmtB family transcription factor [Anaeromyxobacteraceae bacterium]